jgi:hypothetical protein
MNLRSWSKSRLIFLGLGIVLVVIGIWLIASGMLSG